MKILFITTDWNTPYRIATGEYGGVGYYRAHGPAKALCKLGHDVDVKGKDLGKGFDTTDMIGSYKKVFAPYDVVVIKQADTANSGKLIGACKELHIPVVMDLDDLITELDPDNPATKLGYEKGDAKQALAVAALSMVDGLFVSTQTLKDEYTKYLHDIFKIDMPVYVLPNYCDKDLWTKIQRNDDDNFVVGWQGSISHDGDVALVLPAMKKFMAEHDDAVFMLTGGIRQETYDDMFVKNFEQSSLDRIVIQRGTESFAPFPEYLSRHQWDIGIAPLRNTRFTRCKSHIKWLEYSLLQVPTIASNVKPYSDYIENGVTGVLVDDDSWYDAISEFYNNTKKGLYIARHAHKHVVETQQYKQHVNEWVDAFDSVIKAGSKSLL